MSVMLQCRSCLNVVSFFMTVLMHGAFSSHCLSFTPWLFFSLQTCLRHPDCESARINKNAVFQRMRLALEQVIEIVTDARSSGDAKALPISIYAGIKDLKVQLWFKSLSTQILWMALQFLRCQNQTHDSLFFF